MHIIGKIILIIVSIPLLLILLLLIPFGLIAAGAMQLLRWEDEALDYLLWYVPLYALLYERWKRLRNAV